MSPLGTKRKSSVHSASVSSWNIADIRFALEASASDAEADLGDPLVMPEIS